MSQRARASSCGIVATAKALTTRGDLAAGVVEVLGKALNSLERQAARRVALVSISTTLATNAVVEGHGSPIAVVLVGFDAKMGERAGFARALPGTPVELIAGGHDHNGAALEDLDLAGLERVVSKHRAASCARLRCLLLARATSEQIGSSQPRHPREGWGPIGTFNPSRRRPIGCQPSLA